MNKMTNEVIERIIKAYEKTTKVLNEERRLVDEYDYNPSYTDFGLAVKESYLEYVNEVNYDE